MKIMKYYKWIVFLLLLVIGACIVGEYVMPVREGLSKKQKKAAAKKKAAEEAAVAAATSDKKKTDDDDATASANTQETTNADESGDTEDESDETE